MDYKKVTILIYALIGFPLMSISIHFGFKYLSDLNQWSGIIIGAILLLISGILFFQAKKAPKLYILCFGLNMIGVGLSMTTYYVFKAYQLNVEDFMVAIMLSLGLISLFSFLTYVKFIARHIKIVLSLLVLGFFIGSLALWLSVDEFTGLSFYFLNVAYFYLIAIMSKNENKKDLYKEMGIVSFGSFFIISFIVLVILSEGEVLQGVGEGIGELFIPTRKKK